MFTGIITAVGQVHNITATAETDYGKKITIKTPPDFLADVKTGDSIAINGACMTVLDLDKSAAVFNFDISAESLAKTAPLAVTNKVNLEKAMLANTRLDGHLVLGHVDCCGTIAQLTRRGESYTLVIDCPGQWRHFFAYKGSVTINGISLTINEVIDSQDKVSFTINLIPHTYANTNLQYLQVGDGVNVEVDTIVRYLARMLGAAELDTSSNINQQLLNLSLRLKTTLTP